MGHNLGHPSRLAQEGEHLRMTARNLECLICPSK
jgi:hypothetical protein